MFAAPPAFMGSSCGQLKVKSEAMAPGGLDLSILTRLRRRHQLQAGSFRNCIETLLIYLRSSMVSASLSRSVGGLPGFPLGCHSTHHYWKRLVMYRTASLIESEFVCGPCRTKNSSVPLLILQ
jgi:hypothetical protein